MPFVMAAALADLWALLSAILVSVTLYLEKVASIDDHLPAAKQRIFKCSTQTVLALPINF